MLDLQQLERIEHYLGSLTTVNDEVQAEVYDLVESVRDEIKGRRILRWWPVVALSALVLAIIVIVVFLFPYAVPN